MVEDKIEGLSVLLISRTDKIVYFLVKTIIENEWIIKSGEVAVKCLYVTSELNKFENKVLTVRSLEHR